MPPTSARRCDDVTVVDAASDPSKDVAGQRIELGGKPELAVADGKGQVFVDLEDKNEIVRVDAKSLKATARFASAPGEEPSGLAIDVAHGRLFAACGNETMVVLDSETGKVLATPPVGDNVDGAAFDPATSTAFAPGGDGTLTAIRETSPGKFEVVQTIATQAGARTVALDPTTGRLYLPTAEFGPAPAPTAEQPHPRPTIVPGSFVVLVVERADVAGKTGGAAPHAHPLGDLSGFATIAKDARRLVEAGDFSGAKARARDLESSWDDAEGKLKKMSPSDWHVVDKAIDAALDKIRARSPDKNACTSALDALLTAVDKL